MAWRNFDFLGSMKKVLQCPVGFDTDVNGSVLGEVTFGQAKGKSCALYLTIGTGIGAGIYIEGKLLHGMLHPEAGHVLITRRETDTYGGKCPYHKNCLEGLAAGPAIEGRYGKKVTEYLGGYVNTEELSDMEHYIVPASLHDDQGSMGCLELGRKALED